MGCVNLRSHQCRAPLPIGEGLGVRASTGAGKSLPSGSDARWPCRSTPAAPGSARQRFGARIVRVEGTRMGCDWALDLTTG